MCNTSCAAVQVLLLKRREPREWRQLYAASVAVHEGGAHSKGQARWTRCRRHDHLAGDSSHKETPSSADSSSQKPDTRETSYKSGETVHVTETVHTYHTKVNVRRQIPCSLA
jgi:hypothetical protein